MSNVDDLAATWHDVARHHGAVGDCETIAREVIRRLNERGVFVVDVARAVADQPFTTALARQRFQLAALVSDHQRHALKGDWRSDCPECVADSRGNTPSSDQNGA